MTENELKKHDEEIRKQAIEDCIKVIDSVGWIEDIEYIERIEKELLHINRYE